MNLRNLFLVLSVLLVYNSLHSNFFARSFMRATSLAKHKKYIFHFDVNKTLVGIDPAGGKALNDILIHSLADRYKYCWGPEIQKPINYSDYIKTYVLPGASDDRELKKLRVKKISDFIEYLKETGHPLYHEAQSTLDNLKIKIEMQNGRLVFDSFYRLINHLMQHTINFTIIIRTFGDDIESIVKEFDTYITPGFINKYGKIKNRMLHVEGDKTFETSQDIYNFFKTTVNIAIQDSWKEWSQQNEHQHFGKLFPVDPEDAEIVSIILDDNIIDDPESTSNIVDPVDAQTGGHLNVAELIKKKRIFVVDTIAAILNPDYFIELIESVDQV